MIGLTSEITDAVTFGRRDHHLRLCPQMKQEWSSRETNPLFSAWQSDALATRLTARMHLPSVPHFLLKPCLCHNPKLAEVEHDPVSNTNDKTYINHKIHIIFNEYP